MLLWVPGVPQPRTLGRVIFARWGWRTRMFVPGGRQAQVLELLARGFPNKQIARMLQLSEAAIEYHVHRIFVSTGFSNRLELALWWRQRLLAQQPAFAERLERRPLEAAV